MKKNSVFYFRVAGHPIGRQEPQIGRGKKPYTPTKTKKYYEHIRNSFQQLYPRLNDTTHRWRLRLDIYVCGKQYPDCSNVIKAYEDSLQGVIWVNDKAVWQVEAMRHAVKDKKDEGVFVYAAPMEEL